MTYLRVRRTENGGVGGEGGVGRQKDARAIEVYKRIGLIESTASLIFYFRDDRPEMVFRLS